MPDSIAKCKKMLYNVGGGINMGSIFIENFFRFDWSILLLAFITFICSIISLKSYQTLKQMLGENTETRKENYSKSESVTKRVKANETQIMKKRFSMVAWYGSFVNLITIFPVLGMMGTVLALLKLGYTGEFDDNVTSNFLSALTSTFWGAVGGLIFKFEDCFLSPRIEHIDDRYHIGIQRENLNYDSEEEEEKNET